MRKLSFYVIAVCAFLSSYPISAGAVGGGEKIFIKATGYRFMVEAFINGRIKANLIIDTGSSLTVISDDLASKLEIVGKANNVPSAPVTSALGAEWMRLVTFQTVSVGGQEAHLVEGAISSHLGEGVDGLLGMSFLNDFSFIIDGPQKRLILKPAYDSGKTHGGKNKQWWSLKFAHYLKLIKKYSHYRDTLENGSPPILTQHLKGRKTFRYKEINRIVTYYKGLLKKVEDRGRELSLPASWQNNR